MALQLVCLRTLSSAPGCVRGNMTPYAFSLLNVYGSSSSQGSLYFNARYLRTGGTGGNERPYDTPQVRQNSASATIAMPLNELRHVGVESNQYRDRQTTTTVTDNSSKLDMQAKNDALKEKLLIQALTYMTKTYDFLTLPIYSIVQQPWKKQLESMQMKAIVTDESKNEWGSVLPPSNVHLELNEFKIDTMEKLFAHAVMKHENKNCIGTREVFSESDELDAQGKLLKKYELGDYQWRTYNQVNDLAEKLSRKFSLLDIKPKEKIAIFAETRAEWLITAMAAFKHNVPIVTVFTTLGDDGVIHALNETEVTCLFTSEDLMPRCHDFLKNTPLIKNVVFMEKNVKSSSTSALDSDKVLNDVKVQSLSSLIQSKGQESQDSESTKPHPNDTAIIMYTSGSTGVPKGVVISHWNLVSALRAVTDSLASVGESNEKDAYMAYLPLAHAMELMSEAMCFMQGIKIGYSSPLTMTCSSPGMKPGSKGDAVLLSPTIFACVPLVLERISKGVHAKIADKGKLASVLFDFFCKYKMNWVRTGYSCPLVDRIFFYKIRNVIGGRLRLVLCGGAPLAPQTQELIRTILCAPVIQGYGLTETCAASSMSLGTDLTVGRVGGPISSCKFRLVDWEEGGYKSTDKPHPRGELVIGGENVAVGYYKKSGSTDFFMEDGKKWFRSGDIVEVEKDGVFKIIDRKKDLVKLSSGEYISLGKVEAILKTSSYVENICVFADPLFPYPVAVMVGSQIPIENLAKKLGISALSFSQLTKDPKIREIVLSEIQKQARLLNLRNFEIPRKIHLDSTIWLPQSGLVTAALKIKRNNVHNVYKDEVQQMLQEVNNV